MENNQELLTFLAVNPKSTKEAIRAATSLNGLFLFNLLKKLVLENKVADVDGNGIKLYSLGDVKHKGIAPEHVKKEPVVKAARDNSKFTFNGQEYGKGPLVRAIVEQYVKDHPASTYDDLAKVFPREPIMPRFGIFEEVEKAKIIAKKGNRYFTKEEQVISLADCKVVVTNQWTKVLLDQFLGFIQPLRFKID